MPLDKSDIDIIAEAFRRATGGGTGRSYGASGRMESGGGGGKAAGCI